MSIAEIYHVCPLIIDRSVPQRPESSIASISGIDFTSDSKTFSLYKIRKTTNPIEKATQYSIASPLNFPITNLMAVFP